MDGIYEIRTVKDFLTVPAEKREAALADFRMWLEMNDVIAGLGVGGFLTVGDSFKWKDDGKQGCSEVNIKMTITPDLKVTP